MKTEFIRIYKSVHTWAGIVSGMALFIAFYAGAITVFKAPLNEWVSPPTAVARVTPLDQVPELITKTLRIAPKAERDFTISLGKAEAIAARMTWAEHIDGNEEHDDANARHFSARLDGQHSAVIEEIAPSPLSDFIDTIHRVVGLPVDNDSNRWVMGIFATLYALALVSGVIVLLPSLVKDFFALRIGKNIKRMWLDAHNIVGIISLPFHIIIAITAVAFAFHDGIYVVQDQFIHEGRWSTAFSRQPHNKNVISTRDPAQMLPPLQLLAAVKTFSPTFEPNMMQYQSVASARATVRVWGTDATAISPRARGGFIAVNPYSGLVVNSDFLPGKQSTPNLFISSFFALHMAAFGNTAGKWLYFLLGLAGAWLFYSGNLLWIESRRKKAPRQPYDEKPTPQRRDAIVMACVTVGVCLGCICGVSATIFMGKWLNGHVDDLYHWHRFIYYAVFFGAISWSCWRGAASAATHLLFAASALTFAIPATSLMGLLFPTLGIWANTSLSALSVDLTAFGAGLAFCWLAITTRKRTMNAPKDSVWSLGCPVTKVVEKVKI